VLLPSEMWDLVMDNVVGRFIAWADINALLLTAKMFCELIKGYARRRPIFDPLNVGPQFDFSDKEALMAFALTDGDIDMNAVQVLENQRIRAVVTTMLALPDAAGKNDAYSLDAVCGDMMIRLIYHPNHKADVGPHLTWVMRRVDRASESRYRVLTRDRVEWWYKCLRGDISPLIATTFERFMDEDVLSSCSAEFAHLAARFILSHPHAELGTYGQYIKKFESLLRTKLPRLPQSRLDDMLYAIALGLWTSVTGSLRFREHGTMERFCMMSMQLGVSDFLARLVY